MCTSAQLFEIFPHSAPRAHLLPACGRGIRCHSGNYFLDAAQKKTFQNELRNEVKKVSQKLFFGLLFNLPQH
jgi:hypothetical protein